MARGFRVNMSVPELGQALNKIDAYDGKSRQGIENAVQNSTKAISAGARRRVPVKTGRTKKSITSRFSRNKYGRGLVEGESVTKQPHAHLLEFGARATVSTPKTKKAMKIGYSGTGVSLKYFAARANIPARRPRPFMRPAFEDEKPNLIRAIGEAVKKP